ncbi:ENDOGLUCANASE [Salix koriyanagi]|uniref:Endoglucanase n=1 Tax=Salix koriyanagi TaxID=2511006 RepID=A0A9Q0PI40_9ROSI|nr:ENDOGLUCANASE [Salix koriyanagi]
MGVLVFGAVIVMAMVTTVASHDYGDALTKSILFFEGQRSGKLPSTQRMTWRKDSGLRDGFQIGVDLVGGYYDAGDNVKFNFPNGILNNNAGMELGDPYGDHNCWERPEDMDTPRIPYAASKQFPGSEVSAEIAAALAASSMVFRSRNPAYSARLLKRATMVDEIDSYFDFADANRGSYNDTLGPWVCPFYCDFSGYEDELIWGAAWLYRATKEPKYWSYVEQNISNLEKNVAKHTDRVGYGGGSFAEFGWDTKNAGINILVSKLLLSNSTSDAGPFIPNADKFVCSVLPESPTVSVSYSPGGLLFKPGGSNLQHATALSFLLLAYARYSNQSNREIHCGNVVATPARLIQLARRQVDYILGTNPLNMSYMVGYGNKFPRKIHHRGSSLPSVDRYPARINCQGGTPYFQSNDPNPNLLTGAVVGGPDNGDSYSDSRADFVHSEPTTYINAPLVGLLAYFRSNPPL